MKNIANKILNKPTEVFATLTVLALLTVLSIILVMTDTISLKQGLIVYGVVLTGTIVILTGTAMLSSLLSISLMLGMSSVNAIFILSITQNKFITPFMLSIIFYSAMLYFTYDTKHYNRELRSRWLWSLFVSFVYNSFLFIFIVLFAADFMLANILAVLMDVATIGALLFWFDNSEKTKNVKQDMEIVEHDEYILCKLSNVSIMITEAAPKQRRLKSQDNEYLFINKKHQVKNAYPQIYDLVVNSYDLKGKPVILYSDVSDKQIERVLHLKRPGSKKELLFMYVEAKEFALPKL